MVELSLLQHVILFLSTIEIEYGRIKIGDQIFFFVVVVAPL